MEKYTVDLDKVLNDFEYSELTTEDKPSEVSTNFTTSDTVIASVSAASTEVRNKKHDTPTTTISNVFSSLDEYLKTDISSTPLPHHPEQIPVNTSESTTYIRVKSPSIAEVQSEDACTATVSLTDLKMAHHEMKIDEIFRDAKEKIEEFVPKVNNEKVVVSFGEDSDEEASSTLNEEEAAKYLEQLEKEETHGITNEMERIKEEIISAVSNLVTSKKCDKSDIAIETEEADTPLGETKTSQTEATTAAVNKYELTDKESKHEILDGKTDSTKQPDLTDSELDIPNEETIAVTDYEGINAKKEESIDSMTYVYVKPKEGSENGEPGPEVLSSYMLNVNSETQQNLELVYTNNPPTEVRSDTANLVVDSSMAPKFSSAPSLVNTQHQPAVLNLALMQEQQEEPILAEKEENIKSCDVNEEVNHSESSSNESLSCQTSVTSISNHEEETEDASKSLDLGVIQNLLQSFVDNGTLETDKMQIVTDMLQSINNRIEKSSVAEEVEICMVESAAVVENPSKLLADDIVTDIVTSINTHANAMIGNDEQVLNPAEIICESDLTLIDNVRNLSGAIPCALLELMTSFKLGLVPPAEEVVAFGTEFGVDASGDAEVWDAVTAVVSDENLTNEIRVNIIKSAATVQLRNETGQDVKCSGELVYTNPNDIAAEFSNEILHIDNSPSMSADLSNEALIRPPSPPPPTPASPAPPPLPAKPKNGITEETPPPLPPRQPIIGDMGRPQHLEVLAEAGTNSLANTNNGKRKISLIGEPGSTPYNNLYVSKEMSVEAQSSELRTEATDSEPTKRPHTNPYESESSASVSPTFSEASTDSVHSTDSTDTENEPTEISNVVPTQIARTDPEGQDATNDNVSAHSGGSDYEDSVTLPIDNVENALVLPPDPDIVWLGKRAPVWIPDSDAQNCLHCDMKFNLIKRRHHCRACGLVLCSKCCYLKYHLPYLNMEERVCNKCHNILSSAGGDMACPASGSEHSSPSLNSPSRHSQQPNPNNPMEYCSVVSPYQQVAGAMGDNPPTVMVPVGVLKRKGSNKKHNKSVMFCDGIRPGSDLTNLDNDFNYNETRSSATSSSASSTASTSSIQPTPSSKHAKVNRNMPTLDPVTKSFIPESPNCLPPTVTTFKSDITYTDCANNTNVIEMLKNEMLTFALQRNLHVHVKIINMDCCVNKWAWCFTSDGLISVGQDEIVILLEYTDNEQTVPKDVFYHLNNIYNDATKGTTVTELGLSMHPGSNFLDSKNHAGFIFIRPTFQCLQNVIIPKESYLIGILVHRWETPWAKNFPLRLILRLGAEYRYYPSPIISTRHRDSVFVEIGHTIINLLADFRNFTYTLPNIRGLTIHMEDKNTTVTIPVNRYDQVLKSLSNSSDHILAFGGNFSAAADSHLVCIQDTQGSNENSYTTHSINIQDKPRKVTGTSFIVFNGALKSTSGLTAKSSIVEDGLMIQIPPEHMVHLRESLKNMKNHTISCGYVNAAVDETVTIVWGDPDTNFNIGVKSAIDEQLLNGVPSIRVHKGKDYVCNSGNRLIRWTEVFIMQNGEETPKPQDPVDVSKISESIAKATCQALVKYLDLLASNNFYKIGIRANLHVENVSYSAGSNGIKLPPIYMKSLDNELIPVLHRITSNNFGDNTVVLELIFRILNV